MKTRILIADDHKILRDGLRSLLERQPNLQVVGEAEDDLPFVGTDVFDVMEGA